MAAFHRTHYRPENLAIILIGDISSDAVFRALEPIEDMLTPKVRCGLCGVV